MRNYSCALPVRCRLAEGVSGLPAAARDLFLPASLLAGDECCEAGLSSST
jgi:hypothetical protein